MRRIIIMAVALLALAGKAQAAALEVRGGVTRLP